jgi:two-component system response regulator RpfG
VRVLEGACALHDIGEMALPDALLLKPGAYSADEHRAMQAHTTLGHAMLHDSRSRFITAGAAIALGHHERYDGSGYPQGLAGTAIPVFARIAAIADVLSALTTPRPDRPALPLDDALAAIEAGAGTLFDPGMVGILLGQRARIEEIHAALAPAPLDAPAEAPRA